MVIDGTSQQRGRNMSAGTMPQLATAMCKVSYTLRKVPFPNIVQTARHIGDITTLEHLLDCPECREAILNNPDRHAGLSMAKMDEDLTNAIEAINKRREMSFRVE
jgi:hypothetical protein